MRRGNRTADRVRTGGVLLLLAGAGATLAMACGGGGVDARYPAREHGCPVHPYPGSPTIPVDELGTVTVDCAGGSCERRLYDAVCERGGDVAWGMGDNALTATSMVAHAAHSRRATQGPREPGCAVKVFDMPTGSPPMKVENIGPVKGWCDERDEREVCLRVIEDEVCKLGGDVLWQLEGPTLQGNKQWMSGRAAHTR
jgi:hypothetical protein